MTLKEISEKYNIAENTIKTNFKQAQKTLFNRYGINIIKVGRGASASYEIETKEERALTMFENPSSIVIMRPQQHLSLSGWKTLIILAISSTDTLSFRGNIKEFFDYIAVPYTPRQKQNCLLAIAELTDERYITSCNETTRDYLHLSLLRETEEEISIEISYIRQFRELAGMAKEKYQYNLDWITLLKVCLGEDFLAQPCTIAEMVALTGLSADKIRKSRQVLEDNSFFTGRRLRYTIVDDKIKGCKGSETTVKPIWKSLKEDISWEEE